MPIRIVSDQIADSAISSSKLGSAVVTPAKAALNQVWAFTALPTVNADPTAANDLVRKQYVDGLVQGLSWKDSCRVKVGSNVNLSSPGAALDGVNLAAGDRVLCTAQSTGSQNGIYVWNGAAAAMTRATDADPYTELQGAAVFITEGTSENEAFTQTAELSSFASQNWTQFSGAGSIVAGDGLAKTGNTLSVNVDNSTVQIASDALKVKAAGITATELNTSVAGNGLSGGGGSALSVSVDDSSIALAGNNVIIKAAGVSTAKIADAAITAGKIATSVAGAGLTGGGGAALAVSASDGVTVSGDAVKLDLNTLGAATIVAADSIAFIDASDNSSKKGSIADVASAMRGTGLAAISGQFEVNLNDLPALDAWDVGADKLPMIDAGDSNISKMKTISSLATAMAGAGITASSGVFAVGTDGSTITIDGDNLKVPANGIGSAQLAANSVSSAKISDGAVILDKLSNLNAGQMLLGNASNRPAGTAMSGDATMASSGAVTISANAITSGKLGANAVQTAKIQDDAVTIAKIGARRYTESQTGSGATKYDLGRTVDASFLDGVCVFRNGMRCKKVGSSPADASEYTVANDGSGGVCAVTFGSAPNSDSLIFDYLT
tara:strand:- start:13901 stop:15727 length:1827 start_codon:yes stop_codon:yes gene_type:complete